jgi:hypothetical protein
MRLIIIAFIMSVFSNPLYAQELRNFNPGVLGKSVDEAVTLLLPADVKAIDPISISADVKNGKFYATTINYPLAATFDQAKQSLNKLYKKYEKIQSADGPKMSLWRVEDRRFAIQLTESTESIQVIYIQFMGINEVLKNIPK